MGRLRLVIDQGREGARRRADVRQCRDEVEALRLRPAYLFVISGGRIIVHTLPVAPILTLGEESDAALDLGFLTPCDA